MTTVAQEHTGAVAVCERAVGDDRAFRCDIEPVLEQLDRELIALAPVKPLCFAGDPGTGNTTAAMRMADILTQPRFTHARSVYDAMREGHSPSGTDLGQIEAQDILKTSVFDADTGS